MPLCSVTRNSCDALVGTVNPPAAVQSPTDGQDTDVTEEYSWPPSDDSPGTAWTDQAPALSAASAAVYPVRAAPRPAAQLPGAGQDTESTSS